MLMGCFYQYVQELLQVSAFPVSGLIIRRSVVRVHPAPRKKAQVGGLLLGSRAPDHRGTHVFGSPHRSRGRPRFKTAPWDEAASSVPQ